MTLLTCIIAGALFAGAIYLMTSRDLKSVLMGVFLLGHAANVTILAVSRSPIGRGPPLLTEGATLGNEADPLPQALILTAIVIGFAVQAFALTMLVITYRRTGTENLDELT
jgi:multicomponent Na+:H+ antiporter subunit C